MYGREWINVPRNGGNGAYISQNEQKMSGVHAARPAVVIENVGEQCESPFYISRALNKSTLPPNVKSVIRCAPAFRPIQTGLGLAGNPRASGAMFIVY